MAQYLIQVAYTPEAWKKMIANPVNRMEDLQPVLAKLGGKFDSAWFAFGEYDVVGILTLPDNVAAGAFSAAVSAGGACKAVKTTPLMGIEDGLAMCQRAAESGYKPVQ